MIGICLIGCGRAGLIHARNFVNKVPGASLVALADPVPEALKAASEELGVTQCYARGAGAGRRARGGRRLPHEISL